MSDPPPTIKGRRVYGDQADPDGPWTYGRLRCQACGHIWAAVRPFSVADHLGQECPRCGSQESGEP